MTRHRSGASVSLATVPANVSFAFYLATGTVAGTLAAETDYSATGGSLQMGPRGQAGGTRIPRACSDEG